MKVLKWAAINGFIFYCLCFGLFNEVEGLINIAIFAIWVTIVASPFYTNKDVIKRMAERGRSVPSWVDISFDMSVILVLCYHGWFITSAFLLMSTALQQNGWDESEKEASQ